MSRTLDGTNPFLSGHGGTVPDEPQVGDPA